MKYKSIGIITVLALFAVVYASAYIVDETEQVVVTRFGKIIGEPVTEPGLNFKMPILDQANYFPKNLLQWDGDPGQIPTKGKTYIWVDTFARWKIVDPVKFLQTVTDVYNAVGKLNDIIDPAVRNFITSYRLIEAVRTSNRQLPTIEISYENQSVSDRQLEENNKNEVDEGVNYTIAMGRQKIVEGILKQAQPKIDKFGIELVDVQFKRINYVDTVRKSVYNRMIAERKQIAEKIRSEGQGEARKIIGQKERDLKQISSEAYRKAQELKGKADAESTQLYAEAYSVDPEFYTFIKTLELYRDALDKNSSLVISTDSDIFKYLKSYSDTKIAE